MITAHVAITHYYMIMFIYFYTSLLNPARISILDPHVPCSSWRLVLHIHINAILRFTHLNVYSKQTCCICTYTTFVNRAFCVCYNVIFNKVFYLFLIYHCLISTIIYLFLYQNIWCETEEFCNRILIHFFIA